MNKCQFCPEMSYAKRAKEYLMDEQKTQTFAEWLLDFVKAHRDVTWSIEQGPWGEIQIHIRDYSKSRSGVNAKCSILQETYQNSMLSFDDILIGVAKELCEEIENYGK